MRVGVLVGALGLLAAFFFWTTNRTWQYEVVQEDVLYRTSARDGEEFASAALKVYPQGLVLAGTAEELAGEALNTARNYGFKNKARVMSVDLKPGETPPADQLKRFFEYVMTPKRQPVLLVDTDGRGAGMLVAAYRLDVLKLPLEEVEKQAELKDSPAETVRAIRAFAREHAEEMKRPASAPASAPVAPAVPMGPVLPQ